MFKVITSFIDIDSGEILDFMHEFPTFTKAQVYVAEQHKLHESYGATLHEGKLINEGTEVAFDILAA